ncbi:MAG: glycosyltransferase, exosortase A system-associated [Novosphingobium sp. 16-62-11]|uniref:TIGR04063 family PEP-CTERM/XrtA system glycosyltransferase n=1 Tax=Novosphingobium sp. 17-62-19 TaxID=1970406 RepID=UPI000BDAE795|nr:TIGR04063 family PEP-CTERM/XrtA system glycosyltransferase [Novosphingobium sp. 17-62-19]OYZ45866.1 MAG: glycosyltransferase, exosortase A system-associated [Novosphingobium sp. 16-62-11]OZA17359.1 MAG: glycosyltransferase, exosortase A system-associated [Novosphingobium sp. 17-62-19]HQS97944.1 glycosyltransferase, exosortase A system-associated [Novosphingobium sp.]
MTRVLHVLDHSLPLHSGYTFRTRAILKAQQTMGLEVRGVTGQRHSAALTSDPEEVDGLLFHRTPGVAQGLPLVRELSEVAALADRIVALAQEWRPDVLHAHSPALCGLAALKAGRRLGIPVVYEIRAFWEDAAVGNGTGREGSAKYWLTRVLENEVVSGADRVVTICDGLRQDLIARGYAPEKIAIMPNGVDLEMFGDPLPRDAALADELGLGEGPVIGFLGSFYPYEGLDDMIAAMPAIVARVPDARLLLVGGGPAEATLREQAAASSAADAIRFVGRVPHHEVDRYYSLVDVVCYPRKAMRLTELVTPLKPLEAMAQGKLVAASDVGGHRELIRNGGTGTLFAPDDPAALASAMAELLLNRDGWDTRREVARRFVRESHDWANNVKRYLPVYQVLLPSLKVPAVAA